MLKKNKNEVWLKIFTKTLKPHHKQFTSKAVTRLLKKTQRSYNSLISRSRKYKVDAKITLDEIRELINSRYNSECKYCKRILRVNNYQLDHVIPISKGGNSNKENLQILCQSCNRIKGSFSEKNLLILFEWLERQDKDFARDLKIRLAGGRK